MRAVLRVVSFVLLVTLGGAVPAGVAASFAEQCCEDDAAAHDDGGDGCPAEEKGDCDCPLGCDACCAGAGARAITPASRVELQAPFAGTSSPASTHSTDPPPGANRDILHVPKLAA